MHGRAPDLSGARGTLRLLRSKQDWIRGLVYPLPHPEGVSLGVRLTKTVWGNVLVGPTRYLDDKNNYDETANRLKNSLEVPSCYCLISNRRTSHPPIRASARSLTPPGNRGEKRVADFITRRDPRFPCVVQLMGIESPGPTAAPSIAEQVRDLAVEILG